MCLATRPLPRRRCDVDVDDATERLPPRPSEDIIADDGAMLLTDDSSRDRVDDSVDLFHQSPGAPIIINSERALSSFTRGESGKGKAHHQTHHHLHGGVHPRWRLHLAGVALAVFSVLFYPHAQVAAELRYGDGIVVGGGGVSTASAPAPPPLRDDGVRLLDRTIRSGSRTPRIIGQSTQVGAMMHVQNDDNGAAGLVIGRNANGGGRFYAAKQILGAVVRCARGRIGRLLRWPRNAVSRLRRTLLGDGMRRGAASFDSESVGAIEGEDVSREYYLAALSAQREEVKAVSSGSAAAKTAEARRNKVQGDDVTKEAWLKERDDGSRHFDETVVESAFLPCTLDEFHLLFLSDGAPHSAADYLQRSGDTKVVTSPWSPAAAPFADGTSPSPTSSRRTIRYRHPVDAPMAPPIAGATKEQRLVRYGDQGLVLETRTEVQDVPMADVFELIDRMWVEPADDPKGGKRGVIFTSAFRITFVKRTVFRSIIAKNTGSGIADALRGYEAYARGVLLNG